MAGSERKRRGNILTVASATLFVGLEALATAVASGWALAGLLDLGTIGEYVLMAVFSVAAFYVTYLYGRKAAQAEATLTY